MQKAADTFALDTSRSDKREIIKEASRELLMTVVRLMVIADAVDVSKLFSRVRKHEPITIFYNVSIAGPAEQIEEKLKSLSAARNEEELMARIKDCTDDIANITQVAVLKQNVSHHDVNESTCIVTCSYYTVTLMFLECKE